MTKISEMTIDELQEAMLFMAEVPKKDPCFSGWNFDSKEWEDKFIELIKEARRRCDIK